MEYISFTSELGPEWDRIVCDSPDGWVFSLSDWLEMVTPIFWNMENRSFALRENGRVVAVMPLHYVAAGHRVDSSGWGHGGPIVANGTSASNRRRLWQACIAHSTEIARQTGAGLVRVSISPLNRSSLESRWGVNPLVEMGFTDVSTHARVIALDQSESDLWFGLSQDARQTVKRARAAGYSARRCAWPEMVDAYYRVHVENYERTGVRPHPRAYFEGIAKQAGQHHVLWVGFAPDGSPVAFHNDARFGTTAMYHTGCSQTAHLESGINYLLFWEAILGAKGDGCLWYEAGESFPQAQAGKAKGLTAFKGKFGGELHRVFRGDLVLAQPPAATAPVANGRGDPNGRVDGVHAMPFRARVRNWLRASRDLMFAPWGKR